MNKITSVAKLSREFILELFNLTKIVKKDWPELRGSRKTVCLIFWEPSTRTKLSFEHAAKKLGFDVIDFSPSHSSIEKGESLEDTIKTILSLKVDGLIIRHPETGISEKIINMLPESVFFINAGDGNYAHPTQGLLDAFTMHELVDLSKLNITIHGDAKHSRVIPSLIEALKKFECKNIRFLAPKNLCLPNENCITEIVDGMLSDCDILYVLRIQKERFSKDEDIENDFFAENYQVNKKFIELTKFQGNVMHPGPVNIGIEVTREIVEGRNSLILKQVENGLYLRVALLKLISMS